METGSPATRFRLLQNPRYEGLRSRVLDRVRTRWGAAAAEAVQARVAAGTDPEVEAWHRRAAFFLDLDAMLDLSRPLAVYPLSVPKLLDLYARRKAWSMSFVFLQFGSRHGWERQKAERDVPWFPDIREGAWALQYLCAQGWVVLGCDEPGQGRALWSCVQRGGCIRPAVYDSGTKMLHGFSLLRSDSTAL